MRAERDFWIFLNHIPTLGPIRLHRLVEHTGAASSVLDLSVTELGAAGVSEATAQEWHRAFVETRVWKAVDEELAREVRGEFQILTEIDPSYPEMLRPLVDRPPVLYARGVWPMPVHSMIGMVGTRQASSYGRRMAKQLAEEMARSQIATVSGLALGIDGVVHEATLRANGWTVAALGHGLAHRYPRQHADLFRRIPERGCLLSEFPYEMPPATGHFPRRNRIISGLSEGVVVVEAGIRSGALITARYAAEQGKDVFAVPGSVFSPLSEGCHLLIKEGAQLVQEAQDILGIQRAIKRTVSDEQAGLTGLEAQVYEQLQGNPAAVDELAIKLARPVDQLATALLSLELQGLIEYQTGQKYGITA